ncbi:EthD domain-containing protein [Sphingomonas sp. CCH5-D11]|uniref:EthD domain-containing protein n=1 Tax=Sphingomonas sp. CCH5-D11 TaxID=1768786 RepID=UPI00082DC550|nr:EthD domain-containing protein [Sphingomonas sp. CCH5-D11]
MIKMIFCLRRRAELSPAAFQAYWRDRHAPLVAEVAPLLRIRRYVQSHSFEDPQLAGPVAARGAIVPHYDGVAELYWDSIEDLTAVNDSKEAREAGRRLLEDERNFIDLSQSPLFWVRENHVI